MESNAHPEREADIRNGPQWRTLAGVAVGYVLACGLILVAFFLLPYLFLAAM